MRSVNPMAGDTTGRPLPAKDDDDLEGLPCYVARPSGASSTARSWTRRLRALGRTVAGSHDGEGAPVSIAWSGSSRNRSVWVRSLRLRPNRRARSVRDTLRSSRSEAIVRASSRTVRSARTMFSISGARATRRRRRHRQRGGESSATRRSARLATGARRRSARSPQARVAG